MPDLPEEPTSAEPSPKGPEPREVAELEERLSAQSARLDEVLRAYSRLQQEREEFRRRLERERERERLLELERGNVALGLLEAVDELDRSLASAPEGCQSLAEGVRIIRDGLLRRALASGIEPMKALGDPFDPTLHEAVDLIACDRPEDDGRVVEEVRTGYRQGERVLRPARVRVGRFPRETEDSGDGEG